MDLSGLSTYPWLIGLRKGDHPAYAPVGVWHLYLYCITINPCSDIIWKEAWGIACQKYLEE